MTEFPLKERYYDCAGNKLEFVIDNIHLGDSYLVVATEVTNSNREGYEFSSLSYSIAQALGNVRKKINEGISTKYLSLDPTCLSLSTDIAKGRITDNGLVIDGTLVSFEQVQDILAVYTGFEIELKIKDKGE